MAGIAIVNLFVNVVDLDECKPGSVGDVTCQEICNNTVGSYVCDCHDGQVLASDKTSCDSKYMRLHLIRLYVHKVVWWSM